MYFLRAASMSTGLALFTAAKNLSTFVDVAAWATCTLEITNKTERAKTAIDLLVIKRDFFTFESNLCYLSIL
jgi:hypothetical protein